jgi:hypothetical protein
MAITATHHLAGDLADTPVVGYLDLNLWFASASAER